MDHPRNNIIFFDDDCMVCNASVKFVAKRDRGLHYFSSLDNLDKFTGKKADEDAVILLQNGEIYAGAQAVKLICKNLKWFRWLYYLISVTPLFIANSLYRLIARNRHLFTNISKRYCSFDNKLKLRIIN